MLKINLPNLAFARSPICGAAKPSSCIGLSAVLRSLATVAIALEVIGFVALEHVRAHISAKDRYRAALLIIGLVFAVAISVEGGDRGVDVAFAPLSISARRTTPLAAVKIPTRREA